MCWLHAVFPIIAATQVRTRCVSADGGGQFFTRTARGSVGRDAVRGVCLRGSGVRSKRLSVSIRRLMARLSSPEGVDISVSSSRYSFHDGSAPASGTLCLSHGGRKSRHSSLCRLSQRCDRQLRRPTRDRDTSIGGWTWGSKGGSGYAQSSVLLSQLPQGLLDLAHRIKQHCSYRLGLRESSEIRRATRQH